MTPTAARLLRYVGIALGTLAALVVGIALFIDAQTPKRNRYLIPQGYAGWLCVTYKIVGAADLPVEDGFRVVRFPATGSVETLFEGLPGKYKDEFYYYSAAERQKLDVGREMGGGYTVAKAEAPDRYTFKFWVSRDARSDYEKYVQDKSTSKISQTPVAHSWVTRRQWRHLTARLSGTCAKAARAPHRER